MRGKPVPVNPQPQSLGDGILMTSAAWDRLWQRPRRSPTQGDCVYEHGARSAHLRWVVELLVGVECRGISFVELGCGSALLTRCLFDVFPVGSAVALDFSQQAQRLTARNCHDRSIQTVQADVLSWETDQRFDLTISIGLVEHFKGSSLRRVIARHADLLKEDGHAVILAPRRGVLWPILQLVNRLQGIREAPLPDHELLGLIEAAGLRVKTVRSYGVGLLLGVLAQKCP